MRRCKIETLTFDQLKDLIVEKHGLTRANDLIQREESLIYGRLFNLPFREKVSLEAAKRVLSGYDDLEIITPRLRDFKQ